MFRQNKLPFLLQLKFARKRKLRNKRTFHAASFLQYVRGTTKFIGG